MPDRQGNTQEISSEGRSSFLSSKDGSKEPGFEIKSIVGKGLGFLKAFNQRNYLENPEFDRYIPERSIFLIASIAEPMDAIFSGAYRIDSPENIWPRIIMSLLGTLLFAGSFVFDFIKKHIQLLAQIFCYLFLVQIAYLNVVYSFTYDYALFYTGALIVLSVYFRSSSSLILYLISAYGIAIFSSYISQDHIIGREVFVSRLLLAVFASYGMAKMNQVLQERLRKTNKALVKTIGEIETLSAVAEHTDNAVLVLDASARIEFANTGFERNTGLSSKKILGKHILNFIEDKELHVNLMEKLKEENNFTLEIKRQSNDQEPKWYSVTVSPVLDSTGALDRYIWVELEITERIHSERKLMKTTRLAQEAVQLKQEFLANMSHEIRTPMNAIVGFSQLLNKTSLDKEQNQYLLAIQSSANNLLVIINDILDFSKIEAGKLEIESVPFSLPDMVTGLHRLFKPSADDKGLMLNFKVEDSVPKYLIGDPVRLNQIFTNLLGNALKFTLQGTVSLNVSLVKEDKDSVGLNFEVKDTGIGISEDKQKIIFQTFTQAEGETTRKYGGTGLGLSIVKSLVELMKGKVSVDSSPGEGSNFSVEIELEKDPKKGASFKAKDRVSKLKKVKGLKLLLAEDNRANQILGKKLLTDLGYEIIIANNGLEVLEVLKREMIDLILMDIQMPEMDGLEATQHIRKLPKPFCDLPIIALTAHALKEEKERYLREGMNDYETKPFNIKDLHSKILKWINQSNETQIKETKDKNSEIMINLTNLEELGNGDEEFIKQMVVIFLEDVPKYVEEMESLIQEENWEDAGKMAHKMKSSVKVLGADELVEELIKVEKLKDEQNPKEKSEAYMGKIKPLAEELLGELRKAYPHVV